MAKTAAADHTTTSTSNNTCIICLQPLLKVDDDSDSNDCDVGVASCGHPCHCSCFESWSEFQKTKSTTSSSGSGVPCPTCQQEATSFVKIFLRPERSQPPVFSGSSDEEEEEEEKNKENTEEQRNPQDTAEERWALPAYGSAYGKSLLKARQSSQQKTTKKKAKAVHKKKAQYYKKRWMQKVEDCKALKLEAKNRRKCHHDDLVDLERSQLMNFRLYKQLEQTIKAAHFRRKVVGCLCFGLGWYCSRKFRFA